jgi:hypothetical protein
VNKITGCALTAVAICGMVAMAGNSGSVRAQTRSAGAPAPAAPPANLDDMLLRWPILPGNEKYSAIDGRRLRGYVDEQVAISR